MAYFTTCTLLLLVCEYSVFSKAQQPGCTVNDLTRNYLFVDEVVIDTDLLTEIPYKTKTTFYARNAQDVWVTGSNYVTVSADNNNYNYDTFYFRLNISQINEKMEISKDSQYQFHFTLDLLCRDGSTGILYASVPLIDTNNHSPFFDKPRYTYNLFSTYLEDFERQLALNPIIATDYDVTNTELKFDIENNQYFDIKYKGVVPDTLGKKHYAQLIPKRPGTPITAKIEVWMTVTDMGLMGNPQRQNTSKLIIIPPSPPTPVFLKPFYVGHLYKNATFVMKEYPRLLDGIRDFRTEITIISNEVDKPVLFKGTFVNEEFIIDKFSRTKFVIVGSLDGELVTDYGELINNGNKFDNDTGINEFYEDFYKFNYLAYELKATYTNTVTNMFSTASATFIVELHHDL